MNISFKATPSAQDLGGFDNPFHGTVWVFGNTRAQKEPFSHMAAV
jgi:hypothetical protein